VAEDLAESLPVAAKPLAAKKRRRGALRGRFLAAYLVLGVIGGAAIAGAFILFTGTERESKADWAAWYPLGEGATYGQQIADHVGRRYRTENGDQIVGVVAGIPTFQTPEAYLEVRALLIRRLNVNGEADIRPLPTDETYMYQLCGLDELCSLSGRSTEERHRLLRREALELALYTFRYIDGMKQVIVLLPPIDTEQALTAVFLEKDDLQPELDQPLSDTIAEPEAPTLVEVPELETVRVDRLTLPFVFEYGFEVLPNASAGLILTPLKPTG